MSGTARNLRPNLTQTEIEGAFTKKIFPNVNPETSNVGTLFNADLNAHLLQIDTPAARTFREQVLSRPLNVRT